MSARTRTETGGGQESSCHVGGNTVWENGLQDVAGEGECNHSQGGGVHDENSTPQQQEPSKEFQSLDRKPQIKGSGALSLKML